VVANTGAKIDTPVAGMELLDQVTPYLQYQNMYFLEDRNSTAEQTTTGSH
jgi:hypothetical protein